MKIPRLPCPLLMSSVSRNGEHEGLLACRKVPGGQAAHLRLLTSGTGSRKTPTAETGCCSFWEVWRWNFWCGTSTHKIYKDASSKKFGNSSLYLKGKLKTRVVSELNWIQVKKKKHLKNLREARWWCAQPEEGHESSGRIPMKRLKLSDGQRSMKSYRWEIHTHWKRQDGESLLIGLLDFP